MEAARAGYAVDLHVGEFGQLEQAILDPASAVYAEERDFLVLAFQPTDIAPEAFDRFHASGGRRMEGLCEDLTDRLVAAARAFRERTGRQVVVANYALPATLPLGPFDAADPGGLTHRLAAQNARLAERVRNEPGLFVWDYAGLVAEAGVKRWTDPRLHLLARVTVASACQPLLARHLVRTVSALVRRPAKCLVLDLDNTLWGGVVGDDGPEGLKLGDDWPGNAFKAFQRTVLGLRDRGILLAVVSKNEEDVAVSALRSHPEMLVRLEDLAATRINWAPKSENMRAIAKELNIGADALVLFDDNPVERAEVRANLPEAGVIEVPTDPVEYRTALMSSGFFDQPALSVEDLERADMYRVDRERSALQSQAGSVEEFLVSLDMRAEVGVAGADTMPRIVQLIGKTNQFNLTTRRHSAAEVGRMAQSGDWVVAWLRLRDRFGDQGLITVGILERLGDEARLDTFLMSCRVMNRHVEHAMMAYLLEHASAMGCSRVIGEYLPTAKNKMVERLLPSLGFEERSESPEHPLWEIACDRGSAMWPAHIRRIDVDSAGIDTAVETASA